MTQKAAKFIILPSLAVLLLLLLLFLPVYCILKAQTLAIKLNLCIYLSYYNWFWREVAIGNNVTPGWKSSIVSSVGSACKADILFSKRFLERFGIRASELNVETNWAFTECGICFSYTANMFIKWTVLKPQLYRWKEGQTVVYIYVRRFYDWSPC